MYTFIYLPIYNTKYGDGNNNKYKNVSKAIPVTGRGGP
jgi:hypothetical protein